MNELERTIEWHDGTALMIDQRVLPLHYEIKSYATYQGVAEAIHTMVIRGAPAIGAAAGFGMALARLQSTAKTRSDLLRDLEVAAVVLRQSGPPRSIFSAIDRMLKASQRSNPPGGYRRRYARGVDPCSAKDRRRGRGDQQAHGRARGGLY